MEKKNTILIILIVILSILVGGLGSYIIFDKALSKDSTNENEINQNETNKNTDDTKEKYIGTYTLNFKDNAPEDVKEAGVSSIKLNDDDTFEFIANMCSGMLTINGNYSIGDNTIVLKDFKVHEDFESMIEVNLRGKDTLEFAIVSENEIYLINSQFGCTLNGNQYGSFIK